MYNKVKILGIFFKLKNISNMHMMWNMELLYQLHLKMDSIENI